VRRLLRRLRDDQAGFTLVELLVATSIGVAVLMTAAFLSDSFEHVQIRVSDRSESVARGRGALEQIVQQLRSQVCLGTGYPAIVAGDAGSVTFYADLSNRTFVPEQRSLTFSAGEIVERVYPGTATGSDPPYSFPRTPSRTRVVLDHVELAVDRAGATLPFLQFYSFDGGTPVRPSNLLAVPLSGSDAARVVRISVNFGALPSRGGSGTLSEPFAADVYVRTADPGDPEHSPLCL
jgi:prepilin-type N-terminal cleavage/methylation domain-containing protein